MRSRSVAAALATRFTLPALLGVVLLMVAACAPLPSLPAPTALAPTAAPPTQAVEPTAPAPTVEPISPLATAVLTPTVSAPVTATVIVTVTAPESATTPPPVSTAPTATAGAGSAVTSTVTVPAAALEWPATTYRDEVGGFEIDYPATWSLIDVTPQIREESLGYSFTLTSWKPEEPGGQGIPQGGSKVDIGVNKGGAASPEAAAEMWRSEIAAGDPGSQITFEEPWDLPGGLTGAHWTIQTSRGETVHELVTAINGNLISVSGLGDPMLFEQIASTLRAVGGEAGAAKELVVPLVSTGGANEAAAAAPLAATIYTVRAGDTLAKIAARFGVSVSAILTANPQITNPDRIYIGQRITIPSPGGSQPPTPAPGTTRVNIYMIGEGGGSVGCGDQVVAVRRDVPRTAAPLTAALNLLLSQKSQYYGQSGLLNALYQSDLRIASITRRGSAWTINLAGRLQLGGVCDNPRVKAQLDQTALQFSTVGSVRYFVNGVPLESLLSGR